MVGTRCCHQSAEKRADPRLGLLSLAACASCKSMTAPERPTHCQACKLARTLKEVTLKSKRASHPSPTRGSPSSDVEVETPIRRSNISNNSNGYRPRTSSFAESFSQAQVREENGQARRLSAPGDALVGSGSGSGYGSFGDRRSRQPPGAGRQLPRGGSGSPPKTAELVTDRQRQRKREREGLLQVKSEPMEGVMVC